MKGNIMLENKSSSLRNLLAKKTILGVAFFVVTTIVLSGCTAKVPITQTDSNPQQAQQTEIVQEESLTKEETQMPEPQSSSSLTHDQLLALAKKDPQSVIKKKYVMTLFLEQAPTNTQADFLSQPDGSSFDTLLIVCNMSAADLAKLDGKSAQSRIYKSYVISTTFKEYNANVDFAYEADCELSTN